MGLEEKSTQAHVLSIRINLVPVHNTNGKKKQEGDFSPC